MLSRLFFSRSPSSKCLQGSLNPFNLNRSFSSEIKVPEVNNTPETKVRKVRKPRQPPVKDDSKVIMRTYNRAPIAITRGNNFMAYGLSGESYLDFTSGICVTSLGYNHEAVTSAINEQAKKLIHTSNMFYTLPQIELAKLLIEKSSFNKVFFCNSGTEANEAALKFARRVGYPNKSKVIAFNGGFHGRTMGALSATYKSDYKKYFEPLVPGFSHLPFNDEAAFTAEMEKNGNEIAAVIVEPIQGEGGVNFATRPFLNLLRKLCSKHKAVLIFDEVQCGLSRCGTFFAHEYYRVVPDIVTLAKPLANGLPIGAVLVKQAIANGVQPGDHGTTFGGNPLAAAVGIKVVNILSDPAMLKTINKRGLFLNVLIQRLQRRLATAKRNEKDEKAAAAIPQITAIRSPPRGGLLIGVDFDRPVGPIIEAAAGFGLLLISAGPNTLRLCPPLIITDAGLLDGTNKLEKVLMDPSKLLISKDTIETRKKYAEKMSKDLWRKNAIVSRSTILTKTATNTNTTEPSIEASQ